MQIDEAFVDSQATNAAAIKNARLVVIKKKLVGLFKSADGSLFFGAGAASGLAVVLVVMLELDFGLVLDFVVDPGVCWASAAARNRAPAVNTPVARRIEILETAGLVAVRMTMNSSSHAHDEGCANATSDQLLIATTPRPIVLKRYGYKKALKVRTQRVPYGL